MSKMAASSGGAGDIVYAIPVMKKLGVELLYVKRKNYEFLSLYEAVHLLLKSQGINCVEVLGDYPNGQFQPNLPFDYNIDDFRKQPYRGKNHIIKSMCNQFGVSQMGWNRPWLNLEAFKRLPNRYEYSLIHLTPRWRDNSLVNWKELYSNIKGKVFFIGFPNEWEAFSKQYGTIPYLKTSSLLEMALLIRDSKALYCNQSVGLTIAQGLGTLYFLEKKPGKTNTLFYTDNENILT